MVKGWIRVKEVIVMLGLCLMCFYLLYLICQLVSRLRLTHGCRFSGGRGGAKCNTDVYLPTLPSDHSFLHSLSSRYHQDSLLSWDILDGAGPSVTLLLKGELGQDRPSRTYSIVGKENVLYYVLRPPNSCCSMSTSVLVKKITKTGLV